MMSAQYGAGRWPYATIVFLVIRCHFVIDLEFAGRGAAACNAGASEALEHGRILAESLVTRLKRRPEAALLVN